MIYKILILAYKSFVDLCAPSYLSELLYIRYLYTANVNLLYLSILLLLMSIFRRGLDRR